MEESPSFSVEDGYVRAWELGIDLCSLFEVVFNLLVFTGATPPTGPFQLNFSFERGYRL